jgi:hypothetical protein
MMGSNCLNTRSKPWVGGGIGIILFMYVVDQTFCMYVLVTYTHFSSQYFVRLFVCSCISAWVRGFCAIGLHN